MKKKTLVFSFCAFLIFSACTSKSENQQNKTSLTNKKVPVELKDVGPEPFVFDIEEYTLQNENFRTAIWTGKYMQMTLMTLQPGEDIGLELHTDIDQFIRIEEGEGIVKMGDSETELTFEKRVKEDFAIFIPAGKWHNLVNDSDKPLKLYSIYAPVEHPHGTVHKTREEGTEAHIH